MIPYLVSFVHKFVHKEAQEINQGYHKQRENWYKSQEKERDGRGNIQVGRGPRHILGF